MQNEAQSPLVVWIVEDNGRLRRDLAEVIDAEADLSCPMAVGSCEDALLALEEDPPPDVLLMDLGLPGISGVEGTRRLRSLSPATRVLVLTIHSEDETVFEAICAGASGYMLKPAGPVQVVEAIRQVRRGAAPINSYIAAKMLTMFSRLAPQAAPASDYGLTRREKEILQHLVDGLTMRQIAELIDVSYHTVDTHLRNVYEKLHVRTRSNAVVKALREGLI